MIREAFIAAALGCIPMLSLAQAPDPLVKASVKRTTGTIQAISQSDRHVVLQAAEGTPLVLEVGEDVSNFDQVKPGDRVVVTYHEGLIAEVKPPGGTPKQSEHEPKNAARRACKSFRSSDHDHRESEVRGSGPQPAHV